MMVVVVVVAVVRAGDGFMVVWQDHHPDGESKGIFARRFYGDTWIPGPVVPVHAPGNGNGGKQPAIAALSDDNLVVAWHQSPSDDSGFGIFAQNIDPTGQALGPGFQISTDEDGPRLDVALAGLSGGGFVALWSSFLQDGSSWGVFGRRYDATGAPMGGEFQVNTTSANAQERPGVAALSDGGFLVSWQSMGQDGDDWGVFQRRYSADGAGGPELAAANATALAQTTPACAPRAAGGWVTLWASGGLDGGGYGIFGQLFDVNSAKAVPLP